MRIFTREKPADSVIFAGDEIEMCSDCALMRSRQRKIAHTHKKVETK